MLKLYYAPGTCALASHIALECAGATYEAVRLDFHERVREAYLAIARREPERVTVIASSAPKEEVSRETWTRLAERFAL